MTDVPRPAAPEPCAETLAAGAALTRQIDAVRDAIAARMRALPADNAGLLLDAQLHAEAAQRAATDLVVELGILFQVLSQIGAT